MSVTAVGATGGIVQRHAERLIEEAVSDTRVILVNGARQAGKSTLARLVAKRHDAEWRSFDDPQTLGEAKFDPRAFVVSDRMIVIDEVQRYPEILLSIKERVDTHPRPGSFLLTGSAHVMGLRSVPDRLVGRIETIELWPFSQGEIDGTPDGFIDRVFSDPLGVRANSSLTKADYAARVVTGGFPEAQARSGRRLTAFYRNYFADLVNREVRQVWEVQRADEFLALARLAAPANSGLLVPANLARATGLAKGTVSRYLAILHEVFAIKIIPAWAASPSGRVLKTPKLAFVDSGLVAEVLNYDVRSLIRLSSAFGGLLESFVAMELARAATWSLTGPTLSHYRTKDGVEVDIVLQDRAGRVVGIEVKASSTVRGDDFKALRHLARRLGPDFLVGLVLYAGPTTASFGDRFRAMPISAVWEL
ncbi:MAG: ATP-binding protein [Bifidobacteriaceae bacterium]|jgi:predicted AAA+ superfamily ATPase|nr:ATP-binding protein [Bifidobacteriaceae bacterium]